MMLQRFHSYFSTHFPYLHAHNCKLLVAVSGGLDSVVLTHLLHNSNIPFAIAHCNFKLRGAESERDENFVRELAKQYNKEIYVTSFNTSLEAETNKVSIQEAARNLRYNWFLQIIESWKQTNNATHNLQYFVATAHHANDSIETMLINFFRGTGIGGLHGILPKQNNIIRPLLFASREQIAQYATEQHLQWVEDSSNASDKYTRNFLRLRILPAIKEIYPAAEQNLLLNTQRFAEAEMLYNQAIALHKKKLVTKHHNELHIPVLKLQKTEPLQSILWEIVKGYGFTAAQVADIRSLLSAESGKYVASATHRVIKNRNWLIIAPVNASEAANILIEKKDNNIVYEGGSLQLSIKENTTSNIPPGRAVAVLDAAHISYPLLLRKWKQGDYFYPLGMMKKKKVSRFLIDQKVSAIDKEKLWVVEADKKIVWIVGYRIDERFKVTATTKTTLTITADLLA